MLIDVEAAKQKYLSQWSHCAGKRITAVDGRIVCDCGDSFPWTRALGEDVALALEREWMSPNAEETNTGAQPTLW